MSELSTSSNVGDDDQQQLQITAEEKAAVADNSNSKGSSSSSISSNSMPTPKRLPNKLPKELPKKLPKKSSAAAAASASSGARVTDDLSMSTQMQLKRDLAAASISSSSNNIYATGRAPARHGQRAPPSVRADWEMSRIWTSEPLKRSIGQS